VQLAGNRPPVANWDGISRELEVDMTHYKPIQLTGTPPRLHDTKLQQLMDFCAKFVTLPDLEVVDKDGVRITMNLRQLLKYDPHLKCVPLRPDWRTLDVAYAIAMRCFKEYWGCPEEQLALLAEMSEADLAALLVSRLLMRFYFDSVDPRHNCKVPYVACDPKRVHALAEAFFKRAGLEKYTVATSKPALKAQRRSRNPKVRKLAAEYQQRYRNFG
jgi:hypothetical protein